MGSGITGFFEFRVEKLEVYEDHRGSLNVLDALAERYFPVTRVFFISDFLLGETRGRHGHHDCNQIVICLAGSLNLELSLQSKTHSFILRKNEYLYLPSRTWAALKSLDDSTHLAVLCSENYDSEDFFSDPFYYSSEISDHA